MRLYRDRVSSLATAEILAIACDMSALASATMFTCGARSALLSRPLDVFLLAVWCLIPRALARLLQLLARPSSSVVSYVGALGLGVALSALLLGGWETIHQVTLRDPPLDPVSALPIFLGWCSAIALFHPGAYLLHDFLLWGIILVGLKDGCQDLFLWLPVFFLSMFGSSSARRLVHDTFATERWPRLNLQNAVVSSLLGAVAALLLFGATLALLGGPGSARRTGPPGPQGRSGDPSGQEAPGGAWEAAWEREPGRGVPHPAGGPGGPENLEGPESAPPVIGHADEVSLANLSGARFDPSEVLRVRAKGVAGRAWRPAPDQHWRALCLVTYDPARETWVGDATSVEHPWPERGPLPLEAPGSARTTRSPIVLDCRIVGRGLRSLPLPELALELRSRAFQTYRLSSQGDIFPLPSPGPGSVYSATIPGSSLPAPTAGGRDEPVDPRLLQVPPDLELGVDLRTLAGRIFTGARSDAASRLGELRAYFARELTYSLDSGWRPGESALPVFLEREQRGDCTHFSTAAALLLRAAGIPARVIAGFLGARWDEPAGEAVVINGSAHAWIEVLFPGDGWHVVDPTAWVEIAPGTPRAQGTTPGGDPPQEEQGMSPPGHEDLARGEDAGSTPRDEAGVPGAGATSAKPPVAGGPGSSRNAESPGGTRQWIRYGGPGGAAARESRGASASAAGSGRRSGASTDGTRGPQAPGGESRRENEGNFDLSRFVAPLRTAIAVSAVALIATLVILALRRKRKEQTEEGVLEEGEETGMPGDVLAEAESWLESHGGRGAVHDLVREYLALQRALAVLRAHRRPHQTPREHARLLARRREDLAEPLETMNRALYAVLYDGARLPVEEALEAVECCRRLRRSVG